uniref:NADH-ubiquinone oxidoreductase chain 6 n=1 Tax=Mycocalicium subtile TaxID=124099 RepID=A0A286MUM7_9EURO|nr:NADH dehydrogenase subunit 6 [Mycocalicium subtile]
MSNVFVYNEYYTNGFISGFLVIISLASIFFGIFVIISKNPIVSVLYLIGLFFLISCYLILLGINFIGLSYLLVYVGAVSILFLFILMLINVRVSELLSETSNSIPLAIIIGISLYNTIFPVLPYNIYRFFYITYNKWELYFVSSKNWDGALSENSHITSIGNIMYTSYSVWLIEASIILLLAMVGAIVITIKQEK